jgi:uncharacterized membrane protein
MDHDPRAHRQLERLLLFCDAIFAIAITLLVLEIKVPELHHASEGQLLQALADQIPKALGFVFSFLVVGSYWGRHHQLFAWVRGWDDRMLWSHLRMMLCVSFIPFPTAFFSENPASHTALVLYAASLAVLGLSAQQVARQLVQLPGVLDPDAPRQRMVWVRRRMLATPLLCVLAIALSWVSLPAARLTLTLIPVAVLLIAWRARREGH